jgi:hypothetical protein
MRRMPRRVLFIHIPKTGGVSLENLIRSLDGPFCAITNHYFSNQITWAPDEEFKYYFTHAPLLVRQLLPEPVFAFTFLRDPVDRAISDYNHILREPGVVPYRTIVGECLSFAEALVHPVSSVYLSNVATRMLGAEIDLRPIANDMLATNFASSLAWQSPADESTYRRALTNLAQLDFIGFTERMGDDVRRLGSLLGLPIQDVPRVNETPAEYEWPMAPAKRDEEAEQAMRRHSAFDCALYERAIRLSQTELLSLSRADSATLLDGIDLTAQPSGREGLAMATDVSQSLRLQADLESREYQLRHDLEAKQALIEELSVAADARLAVIDELRAYATYLKAECERHGIDVS